MNYNDRDCMLQWIIPLIPLLGWIIPLLLQSSTTMTGIRESKLRGKAQN